MRFLPLVYRTLPNQALVRACVLVCVRVCVRVLACMCACVHACMRARRVQLSQGGPEVGTAEPDHLARLVPFRSEPRAAGLSLSSDGVGREAGGRRGLES